MANREELKSLIDQLPESALETVHAMLKHQIHPRQPSREVEELQQRGREYRRSVEQRFRETLKPGTLGGAGGSGISGTHQGTSFGHTGFHYWDGNALVQQTLHSFDKQEIEIMERFSFTGDGAEFSCVIELSSNGRTVRHEERFPRARG